MQKRILIILVVLLFAGVSAFAGGNQEASTTGKDAPLLAYICKDLSQEWFVGTSTTMKETAMALGAKDLLLFDCAMSPDKYMTALDSAIAQNVDVLIVCPPDQQLSQITVQRCEAAGVRLWRMTTG